MEIDMLILQALTDKYKNGQGPGEVVYAELKTPGGCTTLHLAAREGKTSVCRFLIEILKFDINAADDIGDTPLHLSIENRHRPTTIFLIENGADVTKRNIFGETPLHSAAENGSKENVKLLMSKGADMDAISYRGLPLHSAARFGNHEVLKYMLDLNADPNPTISSLDQSPLCFAMAAKSMKCVKLLLEAGADPNRPCYLVSPLMISVTLLDEGFIRCLLKAGADPNMPDLGSHTPLEHAAMIGRREVVELLFPVTSRNPGCPDWSISEVLQHAKSEEE